MSYTSTLPATEAPIYQTVCPINSAYLELDLIDRNLVNRLHKKLAVELAQFFAYQHRHLLR
ncbi:hypothetical protein EUX98_g2718 [Antrodiella citrinella]|uniref:Uncharacterized protein n=1 Tax=Antrodiella citrinella TaxID=2447956 RepID=A0A4S4MYA5_9APHY|nr:hypothetical protein EUX98_g2718 [Antrodiella citrinella]